MRLNVLSSRVVLVAACLLPQLARADFILDTGIPAGDASYVLSTSQFLAAEFSATSGQTVTDLAAFLTLGTGQVGDTFTFDIYSNSDFLSPVGQRSAPVFSAVGTYTADGWNSTAVDWTPGATDMYWLALQVGSTDNTKGLLAPGQTSGATGSVPAAAFAYARSGGPYTLTGAPAIGLQVEVSPVPVPGALGLFASAIAALGGLSRSYRRSQVARGAAGT